MAIEENSECMREEDSYKRINHLEEKKTTSIDLTFHGQVVA